MEQEMGTRKQKKISRKSRTKDMRKRKRVESDQRFFTSKQKMQKGKEQRWACAHCGRKLFTYEGDHIQPHSEGGLTVSTNLELLCPNCHSMKTLYERGPDNYYARVHMAYTCNHKCVACEKFIGDPDYKMTHIPPSDPMAVCSACVKKVLSWS